MATEEVVQKFGGKWKEHKSENVSEVQKEMGVNIVLRKLAGSAHPEMEFTFDGDKLTITMKIAVKSQTSTFLMGGEVEIDSEIGKAKGTATYEDGKLITRLVSMEAKTKDRVLLITREILPDGQMLLTASVNGVEGKRWFNKVTK